jgi:peptidoglycan/LPS O-acetylase OafA/YrhL
MDHAVLHARLTTAASDTVVWLQTVLRNGALGVSLFFVISGFCIHLSAASGRQFTAFQFWKRRLRRLYPPYFVALIFCMAIVVFGVRAHLHAEILNYPERKIDYIGLDFLAHATMLHGVIPLFDRMGGNPPFWSLAREEYYYAVYLPLLLLRRRRGFSAIGGATVVSVLASWILHLTGQTVLRSALLSVAMWSQWLLGMIAVEAHVGRIRLPRLLTKITLVPIWAILGLLAARFVPPLAELLFGLCFFQLLNWAVTLEKSGRVAPKLAPGLVVQCRSILLFTLSRPLPSRRHSQPGLGSLRCV